MDYHVVAVECEELLRKNGTVAPGNAPASAVEVYDDNMHDGVPCAIVLHPKYGHVVLATAGQGPFVCWVEKERG